MVDTDSAWLVHGLEALITNCWDVIINVGTRDFNALESIMVTTRNKLTQHR
jgi:hypothetical protein